MSSNKQNPLDQFKTIWDETEPFYSGKSTLPANQTSLYYTYPSAEGNIYRHIDFSDVGTEDLRALYEACKPATFGRNEETVLDETFRKSKKMDPGAFAASFDPHSVGILDRVSKAFLRNRYQAITEMEPCKLNVYGEGDFFKAHKDAPRDETMVGTLVIVLPTKHEGGQFVLHQGGKAWTLDFATMLAAATEQMVCFVAFFGDVEHEVLPITSGHRVTLTYKLYRKLFHPSTFYLPTPFHERLKKALVELINDKTILPEGGYLGSGLIHEYVYDSQKPVDVLLGQLKGADQVLAMVCEELGLKYSLTLLYRHFGEEQINLITKSKRAFSYMEGVFESSTDYLEYCVEGLTMDDIEGVEIVGEGFDSNILDPELESEIGKWVDLSFLQPFYRDPATKILEIRSMSSVKAETQWLFMGDQAFLTANYGQASMLISIDPVASRKKLVPQL